MNISPNNFDSEPELYDEIRPGYPDALFTALFSQLPAEPIIAEVGPGTGQATLPMLHRGANVTAIELGASLASMLRRRCAHVSQGALDIHVGDFETVELPHNTFDAVVSATAYHWISDNLKIGRPAELLKPGGLLAVIDTNQVSDPADRGYFDAVNDVFGRYGQARTGVPATEDELVPAIASIMHADPRCSDIRIDSERCDITYTCDEYSRLLRTFSGPQALPENQRVDLIDALCAVARDHFDGTITRPLVFTLTTARIGDRR